MDHLEPPREQHGRWQRGLCGGAACSCAALAAAWAEAYLWWPLLHGAAHAAGTWAPQHTPPHPTLMASPTLRPLPPRRSAERSQRRRSTSRSAYPPRCTSTSSRSPCARPPSSRRCMPRPARCRAASLGWSRRPTRWPSCSCCSSSATRRGRWRWASSRDTPHSGWLSPYPPQGPSSPARRRPSGRRSADRTGRRQGWRRGSTCG